MHSNLYIGYVHAVCTPQKVFFFHFSLKSEDIWPERSHTHGWMALFNWLHSTWNLTMSIFHNENQMLMSAWNVKSNLERWKMRVVCTSHEALCPPCLPWEGHTDDSWDYAHGAQLSCIKKQLPLIAAVRQEVKWRFLSDECLQCWMQNGTDIRMSTKNTSRNRLKESKITDWK